MTRNEAIARICDELRKARISGSHSHTMSTRAGVEECDASVQILNDIIAAGLAITFDPEPTPEPTGNVLGLDSLGQSWIQDDDEGTWRTTDWFHRRWTWPRLIDGFGPVDVYTQNPKD